MKIILIEQGSPEWIEFRKSHIGASEIGAIMGNNPYMSPYQVWLKKTGRITEEPVTESMKRGQEAEYEIRRRYIERSGKFVLPMVGTYYKWEIASSSFDGLSENHSHVFEAKSLGKNSYVNALENHIPQYYVDQCQWQMMVAGAKTCDWVAECIGHPDLSYTLLPNSEYQKKMLVEAKKFWDFVLNDTPPPLREDDYELVEDDDILFDLMQLYAQRKEEKRLAEELENSVKVEIEELLRGRNIQCRFGKIKSNVTNRRIDWQEVRRVYGIMEEDLELYTKVSKPFTKITLSNSQKIHL